MKTLLCLLSIAVAASTFGSDCSAILIDDQNWADQVEDYSLNIQNYGEDGVGEIMDENTTWWLTGKPDADETHDYVGGWRSDAPNEYIVMHWVLPLEDRPGDDLVIRLYSGTSASANVLASVDNTTYVNIGTLGIGTAGLFRTESFDFAGLLCDDIRYVKVERVANGKNTGMFFDAFGSVFLSALIPGDANDDQQVDQTDAQALAQHWGDGCATWEMGDFNHDDVVDALDAAILAANWGYGTEGTTPTVPEPGCTVFLVIGVGALAILRRRRSNKCTG